jgi:hypothetical protein
MKATTNWDAALINSQTGKTAYAALGIQVRFSALEVASDPAAVESVSRRQGEMILTLPSDLADDLRF